MDALMDEREQKDKTHRGTKVLKEMVFGGKESWLCIVFARIIRKQIDSEFNKQVNFYLRTSLTYGVEAVITSSLETPYDTVISLIMKLRFLLLWFLDSS